MYTTENEININADEKYVEIELKEGDRPWVGGINGRFYRISRGKPVKVPESLAKLIAQNEKLAVLSNASLAEYKTPKGKFMGGGRK